MEQEQTTTTTTRAEPKAARSPRSSSAVIAKRVVYYVGGIIVALLALRFVFLLLGANQDAAFVQFIYSISAIFNAPFVGIFGEPTYGSSFFESSSLVAIVIYALVTLGIGRLFTLGQPRV